MVVRSEWNVWKRPAGPRAERQDMLKGNHKFPHQSLAAAEWKCGQEVPDSKPASSPTFFTPRSPASCIVASTVFVTQSHLP